MDMRDEKCGTCFAVDKRVLSGAKSHGIFPYFGNDLADINK